MRSGLSSGTSFMCLEPFPQRTSVDLPVGVLRKTCRHQPARGNHVRREEGAECFAQIRRRDVPAGQQGIGAGDQRPLESSGRNPDHRGLLQTVNGIERGLDLAQLDSIASALDLGIGSAEEVDEAVVSPDSGERSEEHTSELQSLAYLVCRLLLEKKKKKHFR